MDLGKPEKRLQIRRTAPDLPDAPAPQPATTEPAEQAAATPEPTER
jgi:hypothetical protein